MNPRDLDALMAKIRDVLAEPAEDMIIGELHLVLNVGGEPQTLRVPVSVGQFAKLVRDMATVVGVDRPVS